MNGDGYVDVIEYFFFFLTYYLFNIKRETYHTRRKDGGRLVSLDLIIPHR